MLILHGGFALIQSDAIQVDSIVKEPITDPPPKGLGDEPVGLAVTHSGDQTTTIAVAAGDTNKALGPMNDQTPRT